MISRRNLVSALVCLPLTASVGCSKPEGAGPGPSGSSGGTAPAQAGTVSLVGAGATFPYPLYSKWISEYNKANPGVQINYQSIGSGGGIRQISAGTVDFGASDAPMTADEVQKAPAKLHHVPTTLGAVVITYNVPELGAPLKLSADAVSGVFLGTIKKWNDPKIAEWASLAKARACETLHLVSNETVQMHGGIGMTDAHDAGLYLKRARVAEALYGGESFHRDRYARLLGF